MPCQAVRLPAFDRQCKAVCKTFPQAEQELEAAIKALGQSPQSGVAHPGFHPFQVRKIRIGLHAYRLSAARGLRLLFLYLPDKAKVVPLVVYKKGAHGSEQEVRDLVRLQLKTLLAELSNQK